MAVRYKFSEAGLEEIRAARRANINKQAEVRLKVLEPRAVGKSSKKIGAVTGFHPAYITTLTVKYRAGGIEAISGNHYGGNHRNISMAKEAELLEEYVRRSEAGQIVELSEIKAKYEKAVGHRIGSGQIYEVSARRPAFRPLSSCPGVPLCLWRGGISDGRIPFPCHA